MPDRDERRARTQAYYARPETLARDGAETGLWPAEQRLVARFLPAGATVLDVGTGTGRVALALARSGRRATGLDRSESMLQAARTAAQREGLDVPFVHGDAVAL